jgi:hypothetical protein
MKKEGEVRYSLSTAEFAALAMVKPQSITAALCTKGSYHGVLPRKLPSGRLAWPSDSQDRLFAFAQDKERKASRPRPKVTKDSLPAVEV